MNPQNKTFEESMARLEQIVRQWNGETWLWRSP